MTTSQRAKRLAAGILRISADRSFMIDTVHPDTEETMDQRRLLALSARYLLPITKGSQVNRSRLNKDLARLNRFFSDGPLADRMAYWYDGVGDKPAATGSRLHRAKLALAFAWSPTTPRKAERAKGEIVMNCLPGHTNLEQLGVDERYANADNWRIFYQLVSAYRRREPQTIDDAFICSAHWIVPKLPNAL